jgi:mono/diheme cytochrome c family protein
MWRSTSALVLACAPFLGGCAHAPGYPPDPIPRPSAVTDFTTLYSQNCAACHGANGQSGPAIDLANPEYQALVDDASLRKWISGGMPGTEMPAFAQSAGGMLTDEQVSALIAGMRKNWSLTNAAAIPIAYAQTQTGDPHRGQSAYQARCASCHQAPNQSITSPVYLTLVGDQALRTIIIAGRPDIGQPDWSHDGPAGKAATPLSAQDVDDIVTYLVSLRGAGPEIASGDPSTQLASHVSGGRATK